MPARNHVPVLLDEALAGLAVKSDGCYVDGTYGRGGHSGALLERLGPGGRLLALDKDPEAVADAAVRFGSDSRFRVLQRDFADLRAAVREVFGQQRVDGILLDLGTSSPQLDSAERGFSFSRDGPLDMRMNPQAGITAAEWLARTDAAELAGVLREFGEERHSRRIAAAIMRRLAEGPLESTAELAEVVRAAVPAGRERIHPATRVFQALRIVVNRELESLERALRQSLDVLAVGGRLVVISFHSLEDRIVKRFIAAESAGDPAYRGLPDMPVAARPRLAAVGRLVRPGPDEVERNPRSRSARLRIGERLGWDLAEAPA